MAHRKYPNLVSRIPAAGPWRVGNLLLPAVATSRTRRVRSESKLRSAGKEAS